MMKEHIFLSRTLTLHFCFGNRKNPLFSWLGSCCSFSEVKVNSSVFIIFTNECWAYPVYIRLAEGISFDSLNTGFLFHVLWSCDSEFRDSLESLLLTENFHHVRHSPDAVKVLHFCGQFIPLLTPCRKGQDCMFQFSKPVFVLDASEWGECLGNQTCLPRIHFLFSWYFFFLFWLLQA